MKEKDFDDIGKRLYDVEVNPPKDGWKNIGSALHASTRAGKVVWLRKNWWKPLIVLIPVGFYFLYSGLGEESLSLLLHHELSAERSSDGSDTISIELGKSDIRTGSVIKGEESNTFNNQSSQETVEKTSESYDEALTSKENNATRTQKEEQVSRVEAENENEKSKINGRKEQKADDVYSRSTIGDTKAEATLSSESEMTPPPIAKSNDEPGYTTSSREEDILASEVILGKQVEPPLIVGDEEEPAKQISPSPSTDLQNTYEADSTNTKKSGNPFIASDTAVVNSKESSENAADGSWRLTVSLIPQYASKSVKPVVNDEVLVTGIDRSRNSHRIGFGFGMGVGKAITKTFYVDAQVSYAEAQQDIYFSYTTGKVDTLLAVHQPDQTVRVTPVYEIGNREISSKFSYGGIRLGATHYFWSSARRRFNISAMAGAHYLISANVKEHLNGQWVELSSDNLNKVNYTIMVSAGYNINLRRGWELMINPALTYYLRKVKNSELPYNLNQQALGLNFMFSKTLGKK